MFSFPVFSAVGTARLPDAWYEFPYGPTSHVRVSGWGDLSSYGQGSDVLMEATVPVYTDTGMVH